MHFWRAGRKLLRLIVQIIYGVFAMDKGFPPSLRFTLINPRAVRVRLTVLQMEKLKITSMTKAQKG